MKITQNSYHGPIMRTLTNEDFDNTMVNTFQRIFQRIFKISPCTRKLEMF